MQRRDFVTSVLVGGIMTPVIGDRVAADNAQRGQQDEHHHLGGKKDERNTNHTVSFGHWLPTPTRTPTQTSSPIDRFSDDPMVVNPRFLNGHDVLPKNLRIRVGDSVTFSISGFHLLVIYRRRRPEDIDITKLLLSPPMTFPPLIDDATNRLYRGLDPRTISSNQDRVEVVGFNTPGRYLVLCGVLPHFFDAATQEFVMYGYVDVEND
jgi:hypothetical protein